MDQVGWFVAQCSVEESTTPLNVTTTDDPPKNSYFLNAFYPNLLSQLAYPVHPSHASVSYPIITLPTYHILSPSLRVLPPPPLSFSLTFSTPFILSSHFLSRISILSIPLLYPIFTRPITSSSYNSS